MEESSDCYEDQHATNSHHLDAFFTLAEEQALRLLFQGIRKKRRCLRPPLQDIMDYSQGTPQVSSDAAPRHLLLAQFFSGPHRPRSGPVDAWVVGFAANLPQPRRFTYRACSANVKHGLCRQSLESGNVCGHTTDAFHAYRCRLLITDASGPYWVTVFEQMSVLLDMSPSEFYHLENATQEQKMKDMTAAFPLCQLAISRTGDCLVVQSIKVIKAKHDPEGSRALGQMSSVTSHVMGTSSSQNSG